MITTAREGVIKFALDHRSGPAPSAELLKELGAWRTIFRQLGLLGQHPDRYAGLGFGNLSRRLPDYGEQGFLISGTQTGHLAELGPEHYVIVRDCDPVTNRVASSGPIKPSSETLSHGILYQSAPTIFWVMHLHSPEIFTHRNALDLPCTNPTAAYGTPEMAAEIRRLALGRATGRTQLIVMTGHADGILAFGRSAEETGQLVVITLARALMLDRRPGNFPLQPS